MSRVNRDMEQVKVNAVESVRTMKNTGYLACVIGKMTVLDNVTVAIAKETIAKNAMGSFFIGEGTFRADNIRTSETFSQGKPLYLLRNENLLSVTKPANNFHHVGFCLTDKDESGCITFEKLRFVGDK